MMNDLDTLKSKLISANKAYRDGNPFMEDQEFDDLLEEYQSRVSPEEYSEFRNTLFEKAGKIKHKYIMGSLDKLKKEEPEDVLKFIRKYCSKMSVSAKVDGISSCAIYKNGKLVDLITRGDGRYGISFFDKSEYIKFLPKHISIKDEFYVRGEIVCLNSDFEGVDSKSNPRNYTAGVVNRKDWSPEDVSKLSFICYTILGKKYKKDEQFKLLKKLGFTTAWNSVIITSEYKDNELIDKLTECAFQEFPYETDGLVISNVNYINEDEYRPDAQKAFKINNISERSVIIDIVWEGPSKNGIFVPVAIIEPRKIQGTIVSRITLNNIDWIKSMGLKIGSEVEFIKSGAIIPKIIKKISDKYVSISEDTQDSALEGLF